MGKVEQNKLRYVVNKRVNPSPLIEGEELNFDETHIYAYLNESIFNADASNFLGVFTDDSGSSAYTGSYTVDYDAAVIIFTTPVSQTLYARYYGGGSIIWADDINNLNNAVKIIDNNAVYSDGTVAMQGNLNLNAHAITNVTTVNNVNINEHKHLGEGIDGTEPIGTDGIEDDAITTDKILDGNVTHAKLSTKNNGGAAAVETNNIKDKAITNAEIADYTISFTKLNMQSVLTSIFNVLYPEGSIYITTSDAVTCPIAAYVGTWELVAQDLVLQGASSIDSAGSIIPAGLPNITGSWQEDINTWVSGAITTGSSSGGGSGTGTGSSKKLTLDASLASPIYGASDTVQPPAYTVNIWRRKFSSEV